MVATTTSPTVSPVSMEESGSVGTATPREPFASAVEDLKSTSTASSNGNGNGDDSKKKKGKITEFVESSFASFDRRFFHIGSSNSNKSDEEKNSNGDKKETNTTTTAGEPPKRTKTKEEQEEDDAYATFTYLAILTALYLPFLLFLWIRRNVFGTASLVRSLFLGHMLRFGVAFMLLPPSTTRTIVPDRIWNYGVRTANRLERLWNNKRVQALIPSWVHFVLTFILGVQTDPLQSAANGGNGVGSSFIASGSGNGVWPPPALMGLGIFTLLAFVVHPDGLTWIMLSQMRDGIKSSITKSVQYVRLVLNGDIKLTPSEISGTLASIIIFVTIVNHILTNRNAEKNARSSHSREKTNKHKGKKGKKGRGRHCHPASQKGRIKGTHGGHYRSTKDMYEAEVLEPSIASAKSPLPSPPPSSRSPSPSISMSIQERTRSMSDMEDTAVSSATSETLNLMQVSTEKKKGFSNANINVRPRVISEKVHEAKIAECVEDDKSCSSSIATAQTNATFPQSTSRSSDMADRDSVSGSSSRRRNRNRKGRKGNGGNQGQGQVSNNKNQTNSTFVTASSSPASSVPTRDTKKTERKPHGQIPSSPLHSTTTTYSKKSQANSLDRKGQRNRMKHQNGQQQGRKSGQSGNVVSDFQPSLFRKGIANTTTTTISTTAMAKQNRERSFTAPEPTRTTNATTTRDNSINRNKPNKSRQVDNQYLRLENINGASTKTLEKPIQMEAFVPVDTLERRMISESIRAQREQQQQLHVLSGQNFATDTSAAAPIQRPVDSLDNSNSFTATQAQPHQSYLYSNDHSNGGFRPGKLELATFLSRVGLVGSLCGNLLADLADVSSLALLTDTDYDRYGIGYAKRSEIRRLLESRGMRQQGILERSQKTIGWTNTSNISNTALRPPPGLSAPAQESVIGGQRIAPQSVNCSPGESHQSLTFLSSSTVSTASNSNFSFSAGSSLNSLSMPLGIPQCNDSQLHGALPNVDSATRNNISLPPISPLGHAIQQQEKVHVNGGVSDIYSPKVHNDEEIEADLQELGGQMAGSILDF